MPIGSREIYEQSLSAAVTLAVRGNWEAAILYCDHAVVLAPCAGTAHEALFVKAVCLRLGILDKDTGMVVFETFKRADDILNSAIEDLQTAHTDLHDARYYREKSSLILRVISHESTQSTQLFDPDELTDRGFEAAQRALSYARTSGGPQAYVTLQILETLLGYYLLSRRTNIPARDAIDWLKQLIQIADDLKGTQWAEEFFSATLQLAIRRGKVFFDHTNDSGALVSFAKETAVKIRSSVSHLPTSIPLEERILEMLQER